MFAPEAMEKVQPAARAWVPRVKEQIICKDSNLEMCRSLWNHIIWEETQQMEVSHRLSEKSHTVDIVRSSITECSCLTFWPVVALGAQSGPGPESVDL